MDGSHLPHMSPQRSSPHENKEHTLISAPHVTSFGCRLNGYEAERMEALAREQGLEHLAIFNTCAVTQEAVRQAQQAIRKVKRERPDVDILVTGCAAQTHPTRFLEMTEVTHVVGNADKLMPDVFERLKIGEVARNVSDVMTATTLPRPRQLPQKPQVRAHVQIQNGCDHRCTFCIIPFGRGNSRSMPIDDVIAEIEVLLDRGAREIVLTGVDLTSYGADLEEKPDLGLLVEAILRRVPHLTRLRLSSIDSIEVDDRLFEVMVGDQRVMPHLHLSLQSGSDLILKRMKRRHLRADAIAFCQRILTARPEVTFGADFIAGFPTETEEMFQDTLDLVSECGLTFLHVFPYSPRPQTPAARMPQVEKAIIKERAQRLRTLGDQQLNQHLTRFIGHKADILVEAVGTQLRGRLKDFTSVVLSGHVDGICVGDVVYGSVTGFEKGQLLAQVCR